MRRYIEHIKNTRAPHERRQYAAQVAGMLTAAVFAVWVGTLGVRLASQGAVAEEQDALPLTAAAAASQALPGTPQLEVSTTSVYSPSAGLEAGN